MDRSSWMPETGTVALIHLASPELREKLFQETGLTECAGAVERRQRPGELRLGFRSVRVLRA